MNKKHLPSHIYRWTIYFCLIMIQVLSLQQEKQIQTKKQIEDELLSLKDIKRSIDGSGNNFQHHFWGSASQPQLRWCPAQYKDIFSIMQTHKPSPRDVSNTLANVEGQTIESQLNWNYLLSIWGQFILHDLSLIKRSMKEHYPIDIPKCDPWFDKQCTGKKFLLFNRSDYDPKYVIRTQINQATSWLDGSMIYGPDQLRHSNLRSFKQGKLKTQGNMLPKASMGYYLTGDGRANENIGLTSLHIIFVREHNRICEKVLSLNPNLSDAEIFRISRNYVIALIQHITYDEFLPSFLGPNQSKNLINDYKYQADINPALFTEFNTAVFRVGHSLIRSQFHYITNDGKVVRNVNFADMFHVSGFISNDEQLTQAINGLLRVKSKERSLKMLDQMRNFKVGPEKGGFILDLYSLNLHRGRDHGLCSYKKARDILKLPELNFQQLFGEEGKKIQQLYKKIENVDLLIGILGEKSIQDSSLGEVGSKIVADQFKRIRNADRLWYQNVFPKKLIQEIKQTTLGDIIKRNSNVQEVNLQPFKVVE